MRGSVPLKLNRRFSRLYFSAILVNFPNSSKDSIVEKTHSIIYIVFSNFLSHRFGSLPKSDSLVTKGSVRLCLTGAHTWNLRLGKGCYIYRNPSKMRFAFLCVGKWFTCVRMTFVAVFKHFFRHIFLRHDSILWMLLLIILSKKKHRIFDKIISIYKRKQSFGWDLYKIF